MIGRGSFSDAAEAVNVRLAIRVDEETQTTTMRKSMRKEQRGFTLIELLFALTVAALVTGVFLAVLSVAGKNLNRDATALRESTQVDSLAQKMMSSAATSVSVYTPSLCSGLVLTAHGDNTPCSQVRFYGKDATGTPHYWGWEYTAGLNVLKECLSYPNADAACGQYGTTALDIKSFTATPTSIDHLGLVTQLAYTPATREIEMRDTTNALDDPFSRVVAGNRVVIVDFGNSFSNREVHLLQGGAPFSTATLVGAYIPPNIGVLTAVPNPVDFNSTTAPVQTVIATETNYSKYTVNMTGPYWSATQCVDVLNPAQVDAATNLPTSGGADTQDVTVTPLIGGQCKFTISTLDQSVVVTVNVSPQWTYNLVVTPLPKPYLLIGQNETFVATALLQPPPAGQSYGGTPPASIPVGITATTGTCTDTPAGYQASGTTFTITTGTINEACTLTVSAQAPTGNPGGVVLNNNQLLIVNVYDAPLYTLTASIPVPQVINIGETSTIIASTQLANPLTAPPGSPATVPFTQAIAAYDAGVCKLADATTNVFTYIGVADGTCQVTFTAPLATPTSVTQNIGVGGSACPPGQVGYGTHCEPANPCLIIRPVPTFYQLGITGNPPGTNAPAYLDVMSAIAADDATTTPGVVPNNNILYGYADDWPSTGQVPVKGDIVIAQNTDCSLSITWSSISQQTPGFTWDMVWPFDPTHASNTVPTILCNEISDGGSFGPICGQNPDKISGIANANYIHPQVTEDAPIVWPYGSNITTIFRIFPDPTLTELPIPIVGHLVSGLTSGVNLYYPEGTNFHATDIAGTTPPDPNSTRMCLVLTCP
jgi:prepilin-type N-terminal cleavage/methylation domain-containing protein